MIGYLSGILLEKQPPQILLDVGGVGYDVDVSMQTFYNLPNVGEKLSLFTHLVVREDAHLLFGFATKLERMTFRQLIKVSGIGAKIALGILSALTSDELAGAIAREDVKQLSSVPGIGKKTAERMILELRGKLVSHEGGLFNENIGVGRQQAINDISSTLVALGYSEKEAVAVVKRLPEGVDVGEGVKLALKGLVK